MLLMLSFSYDDKCVESGEHRQWHQVERISLVVILYCGVSYLNDLDGFECGTGILRHT